MKLIISCFLIWLLVDWYKDYKIRKKLETIKSELIQRSDNNAEQM